MHNRLRFFLTFAFLSVLFPAGAFATPTLPYISQTDFNNIIRELSANTSYHSVTPASSMGSIWGFELGVVGGITNTPSINSLVQEASPGTDASYFPHAALLGAVTVPFAITGEILYVPTETISGVSYQSSGLAVKWTASDVLLPISPVNVALRGFYSSNSIGFSQTIQNPSTNGQAVNASMGYTGHVTGLQLMVSPKLPIIEPYGGVGLLSGNGSLNVSGTSGTIFNYTSAQSQSSNPSTFQWFVGADIHLLLFGLGLEYTNEFGTSTYTGKVSLKF